MKLKRLIITGLLFIPFASFSQTQTFTIKGKISPKRDGKFIKIYYEDAQAKRTDSVSVKKGEFKFTGNISSPTVGKLSFGNEDQGDRIDLFLSEGTIRVLAKDSIQYASISGTKLAEEHELVGKKVKARTTNSLMEYIAFRKMPEGERKKSLSLQS